MNPTIGDIVRIVAVFNGGGVSEILNVWTLVITALDLVGWDEFLDGAEEFLTDMYDNWRGNMAEDISSQEIRAFVRDPVAGQWNGVGSNVWTDGGGTVIGGSSSYTTAATMIGFPQLPRYRGMKNMPPPAVSSTNNDRLTTGAFGDLTLSLVAYLSPFSSATLNMTPGVYSESTETFRPFSQIGVVTDVLGTRVTRKTGRGP